MVHAIKLKPPVNPVFLLNGLVPQQKLFLELFSARVKGLVLSSNEKVIKRIAKNIVDDLRKHIEACNHLEKMRYLNKENTSSALRTNLV